jgi:acetyltransferase-like isoleucine patch superfamily enzyme
MSKLRTVKKNIIVIYSFLLSHAYVLYLGLRFRNIQVGNKFRIFGGFPFIYASQNSSIAISEGCKIINKTQYNRIGINKKTSICAEDNGHIIIGSNVGMSGVSICSRLKIIIGDNVLIGANTFIYDTDFHSVSHKDRLEEISLGTSKNEKKKSICIEDNVFIGGNSIILKGVTIGENSIVAAGSVVTKSIPANEIWGGNPASFIKIVDS